MGEDGFFSRFGVRREKFRSKNDNNTIRLDKLEEICRFLECSINDICENSNRVTALDMKIYKILDLTHSENVPMGEGIENASDSEEKNVWKGLLYLADKYNLTDKEIQAISGLTGKKYSEFKCGFYDSMAPISNLCNYFGCQPWELR